MSSRIFQGVVTQLSEAAGLPMGVIDTDGVVISCSDAALIGEKWPDAVTAIAAMPDAPVFCGEYTFMTLKGWNPTFGFSVFTKGTDHTALSVCRMAQVSLNFTKTYYEEKHDRGTFVKNIITDNILPGDIYIRAKELHFQTELPRVVFLIRQLGRADVSAVELLQNMFPDTQQDFVINVNETDIAVVRQVAADVTSEELTRFARTIEDRLKSELFVRTTIGIGRLIYQLPTTLCEIFLSEVFKKNSIDSLDQETLFTINMFFENSLNVSETSRKLFVHRNTLVYRLEKIKKLTGLDLREFDDAIIFKVALMVKKYLASRENHML